MTHRILRRTGYYDAQDITTYRILRRTGYYDAQDITTHRILRNIETPDFSQYQQGLFDADVVLSNSIQEFIKTTISDAYPISLRIDSVDFVTIIYSLGVVCCMILYHATVHRVKTDRRQISLEENLTNEQINKEYVFSYFLRCRFRSCSTPHVPSRGPKLSYFGALLYSSGFCRPSASLCSPMLPCWMARVSYISTSFLPSSITSVSLKTK